MDGIDRFNTLIRAEFQRHSAPWFSAPAWSLQVRGLDSHVTGKHEQKNHLLKTVYPEIDIYAHAGSIAQFRTGRYKNHRPLWIQSITNSFTGNGSK